MAVDAQMQRPQRPQTQGCVIVLAQSFKQGCLKSAALSRYARMHKDSHTKPLHDATAQMAVDAQMWQPKRLTRHDAKPTEQARRARMHDSGRPESVQGRADPNDRILTNPAPPHFCPLNERGIIFGDGAKRWWRDNPSVLAAEKFAILKRWAYRK